MRYLLILFCCLYCCSATAQTLMGTIVDGKNGGNLFSVLVTNKTLHISTYSSENGEFSITAHSGDIISFSFIGFKTTQQTMPPSLGIERVKIEMIPINYELDEFVFKSKLSRYQVDSIQRKAIYKSTLSIHKATVMSPASFIAEKLSRKSKQLYKFQKNFNIWEKQQFIDYKYNKELVQKMTNLTGDTLGYFMNAYPIPYDLARATTDLELKMWIRNNYKEWKLHPTYPVNPPVVDTLKPAEQ